jgi:hypothetical protein
MKRVLLALLLCAPAAAAPPPSDGPVVHPGPETSLIPAATQTADTTPKERPRMVPPEAYIRTYLALFGGLAPLQVQTLGGPQLFGAWNDYLVALGLPDYRFDIPRAQVTNTLMIAALERLGVALCDRAVEHDLGKPRPLAEKVVFAFDLPDGQLDEAGFATRMNLLHETFLGYPLALAPPERGKRFFQLYRDIVAHHAPGGPFTPAQAGWAAVCYGLIRHPELVVY